MTRHMTDRRADLLARLGDGAVHSGAGLGAALGCSRAAIWKQVAALRGMGLPVVAVRGLGYQLPGGVELLDRERILGSLPGDTRAALATLCIAFDLESTSLQLLASAPPPAGMFTACLAEYQRGGRGRRGRRWVSPAARGLCLSVGWRLERGGRDLPALSLATGVAVLEALAGAGAAELRLKWPNDIIAGDGKLGGILVDVVGEAGGPLYVVAGVGINVQAAPDPGDAALTGGLPPTALVASAPHASRNALAAALLVVLHRACMRFEAHGFAPFVDAWRSADYLAGREVIVTGAGPALAGVARGITGDGALLVDLPGERRTLVAGDVSLRTLP